MQDQGQASVSGTGSDMLGKYQMLGKLLPLPACTLTPSRSGRSQCIWCISAAACWWLLSDADKQYFVILAH